MQPDKLIATLRRHGQLTGPHDAGRVRAAYDMARTAHAGIQRGPETPFITHPAGAAQLIADWGLDPNLVMMALLHEVHRPRRTSTTISTDEIRTRVGSEVADIVEELKALSWTQQAYEKRGAYEELSHILSTAHDLRIVLIKLASGLDIAHNLNLVHNQKSLRDRSHFFLTAHVPIARRLGMWRVKREFEDACLKALFSEQFDYIKAWQREIRRTNDAVFTDFLKTLTKRCRQQGVDIDTKLYFRHIHSIFQRLQKSKPIYNFTERVVKERLSPIQAIEMTVLTETVTECYQVLGTLHRIAEPLSHNFFRDYIALPKRNGYSALHTAVEFGAGNQIINIEIKVQTRRLYDIGQQGVTNSTAFRLWKIRAGIADDIEAPQLNAETGEEQAINILLDSVLNDEKSTDEIQVFTPEGQSISLAAGATPIDFAYAIHTDVGHTYESAKVNGREVPKDYKLKNGEVVEIVTNREVSPDPFWLDIVATSRARHQIRHRLNRAPRTHGYNLLSQELAKQGLPWKDLRVQAALESISGNFDSTEQLLEEIGADRVNLDTVMRRLLAQFKGSYIHLADAGEIEEQWEGIVLAYCCSPRYPDDIVGCLQGGDIVVHRRDCDNVNAADEPIEVVWSNDQPQTSLQYVELFVESYDRPGLARDLSAVVADHSVNMQSFRSQREAADRATTHLKLELRAPMMLDPLMSALRGVDGVTKVDILEESDITLGDIRRMTPEGRPISQARTRVMPNPYSPGRPIQSKHMFFGRRREQNAILGYINPTHQPTSLMICGQRRTGKTSLVQMTAQHPLVERGYVPVFVDLEHFRANDDYQILRKISREINRVVTELGLSFEPLQSVRREEDLYSRFEEYLFDLYPDLQGKRILLILDEFEALISSYRAGKLSEQCFWALRSWTQIQPITLIIVGSNRLSQQIPQQFASMLNVFEPVQLQPLNRDDARQLVIRPVERHLYYEREVVDTVAERTRCYPYYIHVVCAKLFSEVTSKQRSTITCADTKRVLEQLTHDTLSANYYAHLWDRDDPLCKALLACIAGLSDEQPEGWVPWHHVRHHLTTSGRHRDTTDDELLTVAENLHQIGTLEKDVHRDRGVSYRIMLPLFRDWVRYNWAAGYEEAR